MNKKVLYEKEAREKLLSGCNKIGDAVAVTLGPKGKNVLVARAFVQDYGVRCLPIIVTKDGYRVTQEFDLDDPCERAGANMVKEAAQRTVDQAGDGTTSTVVLMREMVSQGMKAVEAGANPMELKRDIDTAVTKVVSELKAQAIQIGEDNEKIFQIATISANNDAEMGRMIANAFKEIGNEGMIDIQAGKSVTTEIKVAPGYRIDEGWAHPYFINKPEKQSVEFENPMILLYNRVITHHTQIERAVTLAFQSQRPLLIICPGAQEQGLGFLLGNVVQGKMKCCVVKAPGVGETQRDQMEDIALVTGATYMADNRGEDIKKIKLEDFGSAKKVVISREETVIIEGDSNADAIGKILMELRTAKAAAENEDEAHPYEKRIAKLSGGVAVIHVGAATETEMKEKMDRFDDSVRAVKSALAEGYTVGGGTAFLRIDPGNDIVNHAMTMIFAQICKNVGANAVQLLEDMNHAAKTFGYNAKSEKIEDLIEAGVIDPVKVLRCALQNAASSATMLLTSDCLIVDTF